MADTAAGWPLHHGGLNLNWQGQAVWRVLATDFGDGTTFLDTWHGWREDARRSNRLHVVALCSAALSLQELLGAAGQVPHRQCLLQELTPHWHGLTPGFHRIALDGGRVTLTLCVGELTALLRAQQFLADAVMLTASGDKAVRPWTLWDVKALARCCRRGTSLTATGVTDLLQAKLLQCGFESTAMTTTAADDGSGHTFSACFNPRWGLPNTRNPELGKAAAVSTCAVIGAGVAGASVASALAARGWKVQVLDQAPSPAMGASSLPAGLAVPHVSVDDCALSRLSRAGIRLILQEARTRMQIGRDWAPTGTLERQLDAAAALPDLWHPQAAWVKPAALVRAWLAQPGISFMGNTCVASLRRVQGQWELLDDQGHILASASRVVIANACGARPLLQSLKATNPGGGTQAAPLPVLRGVRGQLSWAMQDDAQTALFPPHPVNGAGSVVPAVPMQGGSRAGLAWLSGATFEPEEQCAKSVADNHAANLARVRKLVPEVGDLLARQFASGQVHAWSNTRCVTPDRLPLVGPVDPLSHPDLWLCVGMGARGLTFSALCAEWLAARWSAEPWPLDAGLAQSLSAQR
jgi:tRNA 5-methylaminomethyl-2-thiouridine biosynthesis bifunctional protein